MACGSGCCAPLDSDHVSQTGPAPNPGLSTQVDDSCNDACCAGESSKGICEDACCTSAQPSGSYKAKVEDEPDNTCVDACCADEGPSHVQSTGGQDHCGDACCTDQGSHEAESAALKAPVSCQEGCCAVEDESGPDCEDACCMSDAQAVKNSVDPDCCKDKPSPCCNVSCLDRLATRECQQASNSESRFPQCFVHFTC